MPAPCEALVTDPYGSRWRGLRCITNRPYSAPRDVGPAAREFATNSSPISTTAESTNVMSSSVVR